MTCSWRCVPTERHKGSPFSLTQRRSRIGVCPLFPSGRTLSQEMPVGRKLPAKSGRQCCASSARHKCSRAPLSHFAASWAVRWYFARLKAEYDGLMARGIDESQVKTVTEALKKAELDRPPLSRAVNLLQYEVRNLSTERVSELIKLFDQIRAERINELIREILPKGLLTVVLAPASVSLPADCTIKELAEAAKCMLEKQTSETKRSD